MFFPFFFTAAGAYQRPDTLGKLSFSGSLQNYPKLFYQVLMIDGTKGHDKYMVYLASVDNLSTNFWDGEISKSNEIIHIRFFSDGHPGQE